MAVPQKAKHRITMWLNSQVLSIYPPKTEDSKADTCTPCSQQPYLQQPKGGNNPSIQQQMKEFKCGRHAVKYYSTINKNGILIFSKMDEPWKHYTKENKPDTKRKNTLWLHLPDWGS